MHFTFDLSSCTVFFKREKCERTLVEAAAAPLDSSKKSILAYTVCKSMMNKQSSAKKWD
jgi:hypothetical protein